MIKCDQTGSTVTKYVYGWDVDNYIACFLTSHRNLLNVHAASQFFGFGEGGGMRMFWSKFVISARTIMFSIACAHDFGAVLFFGCFSPGFPKLKRCS